MSLDTLNSKLKANTKLDSYKDDITTSVAKVKDVQVLNNNTVLGTDVGTTVNGIKSLDNNKDKIKQSIAGSSAGQLAQVLPGGGGLPKSDADAFKVGISAGVATVTNVAQQIPTLSFDSAGDTIGTESLVAGASIPTVSMSGTDVESALSSLTASLTGIVPPVEPITIVAIGGAVLDELVGAVEISAERKGSLLGSISAVAGEATAQAGGLGAELTASVDAMKADLDKAIADVKSGSAMTDMANAVSAVEGVANDAANAVADATNAASSALDGAVADATSALTAGLPKDKSPLGGLLDSVAGAVGDLVGAVGAKIKTGLGTAQDLFEDLTGSVGSALQSALGGFNLDSSFLSTILKDVMEGGDINLTKAAKSIALKSENTSAEMKGIISKADGETISEFNKNVKNLAEANGIPQAEIDAFDKEIGSISSALDKVDSTISGSIVSEAGEFYTEDIALAELAKRYSGADTTEFPYINSKEELGLEFKTNVRAVSELIIHASESFTNANIGAEEINIRHNEAGHDGIQYHLIIRRNGTLQRGVPLDTVSTASDILGHSANCIDICLVGGINVASEAQDPLLNLSSGSFTQSQMKTLEAICQSFYHVVPGGQVLGHNDIDEASRDPYMDIKSYVENKFGKKSVYKDTLTEQSKSPSELVSASAV